MKETNKLDLENMSLTELHKLVEANLVTDERLKALGVNATIVDERWRKEEERRKDREQAYREQDNWDRGTNI